MRRLGSIEQETTEQIYLEIVRIVYLVSEQRASKSLSDQTNNFRNTFHRKIDLITVIIE